MKELIEKQNDLKNQAENILNTAKVENRAVTDEEKETFDSITKEIDAIEDTLEMEDKINKMETKEIKNDDMTQEQKDIKNFANAIRDFKNESKLTKTDNGLIIPKTIAQKIIDKVAEISPLYESATKYNGKGTVVVPKVDTTEDDVTVAYSDEFSELVEKSNKFAGVELNGFLIGALTKISKSLLKNSNYSMKVK